MITGGPLGTGGGGGRQRQFGGGRGRPLDGRGSPDDGADPARTKSGGGYPLGLTVGDPTKVNSEVVVAVLSTDAGDPMTVPIAASITATTPTHMF